MHCKKSVAKKQLYKVKQWKVIDRTIIFAINKPCIANIYDLNGFFLFGKRSNFTLSIV